MHIVRKCLCMFAAFCIFFDSLCFGLFFDSASITAHADDEEFLSLLQTALNMKDGLTDDQIFSWSLAITTLRSDGFSDAAIAGIFGNVKAEAGTNMSAYALEAHGSMKADEGVDFVYFEAGKTYNFSSKPPDLRPRLPYAYYNGHGLIQFSGSWGTDMIEWSKNCEYDTVEVTHYCSPMSGYGSNTCEKHTCVMANVCGQMFYLIEYLSKSYGDLESYKKMSDPYTAAVKWHDDIEKSYTENISDRGNYARGLMDMIKSCTKVIGNGKIGGSNVKEQTQLMAGNLVGFGYWDESQFVQFQGLTDFDLYMPDRSGLSIKEAEALTDWGDTISARKQDQYHRAARAVFMVVGILVLIWSTMLYVSYQFDRINNFWEGSLLKVLSFGKLMISPDETMNTYGSPGPGTKLVNHKAIIIVTLCGIALGLLLLTGSVYNFVMWMYSLLMKLRGIE